MLEGHYVTLQTIIGFISRFSNIISVALRLNSRLIKRFLNAHGERNTLLKASGIDRQDNRFALLKLMLLEYRHKNSSTSYANGSLANNLY